MERILFVLGPMLFMSGGLILWLRSRFRDRLQQETTEAEERGRQEQKDVMEHQISLLHDEHALLLDKQKKEQYKTSRDKLESWIQDLQALVTQTKVKEAESQLEFKKTMETIKGDCLESLILLDQTSEDLSHLQNLAVTFERWHDGLLKLKENNRQLNNMNSNFSNLIFQASILSLNARIEASRAGKQGKVFNVVAQAMTNLAHNQVELSEVFEEQLTLNDTIATGTFQDIQAGSRMIVTAIEVLNGQTQKLIEIQKQSEKEIEVISIHGIQDQLNLCIESLKNFPIA